VEIAAAERLGMRVVRVPAYSPHAVAEHTIALILALNRKLHRAYNRVREGNFALEGLLGFDLHGRTAGVIGTGKIGIVVARILHGFGCEVLAYDPWPNEECRSLGVNYVTLEELFSRSDIVTLHCPLTPRITTSSTPRRSRR
jgi:D-lactate dehydrogenase